MTTISTIDGFIEELNRLQQTKENPEEWYVLSGKQVGEYSVHTAEKPDDYDDFQEQMPAEEQDATENVEGFYQIGTTGWAESAFVEDVEFVGKTMFDDGFGTIDRRINGLLLVHESVLSEEALEIAREKEKEGPPGVEA